MSAHPNADVFKRVHVAFTSGDMDRLAELIVPDVVWHVPGPTSSPAPTPAGRPSSDASARCSG